MAITNALAAAFLWMMVRRYRADKRALVADVVTAGGATLGVALVFPEVNLNIPYWLLTVWGCGVPSRGARSLLGLRRPPRGAAGG